MTEKATTTIPYIAGDGIGPEIMAATQTVVESALEKAYGASQKIVWLECLAGQKAFDQTGEWLPAENAGNVEAVPRPASKAR